MIEINNLTNSKIDKKSLKKVALKVLEGPFFAKATKGKGKKFDLSIALVAPKEIQKLNKKYRKKDRPTDVLSYTYNKSSGEIVICPQVVKKNAEKFGQPFKKELTQVLIHGILHFLGENHEKSKQKAKQMEKKQNFYLSLINPVRKSKAF